MAIDKLIHSSALPEHFSSSISLLEDPKAFIKKASESGFIFDYEALKPDKNHVGIHLVALGDMETYGINRNGDCFPKFACEKYHDTFVKHGAVYRHHKHDDRSKAIGEIKASAYNKPMGRIELFIHAHKEKAAPELQKLAEEKDIPFSMSCRVPGDICTICNNFRKSSKDPNQCEHILNKIGHVYDDGRVVGMINADPTFFDISFVTKPADRIAWFLKSANINDIGKIASADLAEMENMSVPHSVKLSSPLALTKYEIGKKIAEYEALYQKLTEVGPTTEEEHRLWELRKSAASTALDDDTIETLRNYEPQDVFYALARHSIIMDPVTYVKYAMGTDMGPLKHNIEEIKLACAGICSEVLNSGELYDICNDSTYDVHDFLNYSSIERANLEKIASCCRTKGSIDEPEAAGRAVANTMCGIPVETLICKKSNEKTYSPLAKCVARKYIAYKLASAGAMQAMGKLNERHYALMAARNMINSKII